MRSVTRYFSPANIHIVGMVTLAGLMMFHLAIAPVMFDELSGRLIWYLSTDLSVIFLLFLNSSAVSVPVSHRKPWVLAHIANGFGVGIGVLNLIAVPEPINIVVVTAYIALFTGAVLRDAESPVRRFLQSLS
jgi:hypothetical protein